MIPLFCSEYIKDSLYFGGYPSKEWFKQLIDFGITYFVDLTTNAEKNNLEYNYTFANTIFFPIRDNHTPLNLDNYLRFIIQISNLVERKEKIYIHCKGGHGRSGMVVASLMSYLENMLPKDAIERTTMIHANRILMKEKYRIRKCPDNFRQRKLIFDLFRPIIMSEGVFNDERNRINLFEFIQKSKTRPIRSTSTNREMITLIKTIRHQYNQSILM